jgi:hypothetical protein
MAASFDGYLWSLEPVAITFTTGRGRPVVVAEAALLGGFVVMAAAAACALRGRTGEEEMPQNRWTLHQGQIVMIEESGPCDFLFNVMCR